MTSSRMRRVVVCLISSTARAKSARWAGDGGRGPRSVRTVMCMLIDAGLAALAVWLAFVLRLEEHWVGFLYEVPWFFLIAILATIESFRRFGLYRSPLRYGAGGVV